ncbi:MAG: amidohydrolase family protein [Bacteroidales bacterium]
MLGSDWPVCRLAGEYQEVMKIPVKFLRYLPERERKKIFYQNAIDFYQLKMD